MTAVAAVSLVDRLPAVRGRLTPAAPLANFTWFRCGGPAEALFRPADEADLATFLAGCPADVPITILGVASNTLVRDGGVPGVVIRLGREFTAIRIEGDRVRAGAAAMDINVARAARDAGLAGLEFMVGIPGSVGGALRMNAGAYGSETKDVLVEAVAFDRSGRRHVMTPAEMGLAYRHSDTPADWVFTEALFQARPGDMAAISARMDEINAARGSTQPIRSRTGGSTFANPPGQKSWKLIDEAGCRGLRVGGAQVSEMHCNFLINTGDATGDDLETLGEEVRRRVRAHSGVELRWEIKRVGVPAGDPQAIRAVAAPADEPDDGSAGHG